MRPLHWPSYVDSVGVFVGSPPPGRLRIAKIDLGSLAGWRADEFDRTQASSTVTPAPIHSSAGKSSAMAVPACLNAKAICSSENRFRFMASYLRGVQNARKNCAQHGPVCWVRISPLLPPDGMRDSGFVRINWGGLGYKLSTNGGFKGNVPGCVEISSAGVLSF